MKVYDAAGAVAGRLAVRAAKDTLLGEDVIVINAGEAIITGTKEATIAKYHRIQTMGKWHKGPFLDRTPERVMKRIIRGMLPRAHTRGQEAFKKIRCYTTRPAGLTTTEVISMRRATPHESITLTELCKALGGKIV